MSGVDLSILDSRETQDEILACRAKFPGLTEEEALEAQECEAHLHTFAKCAWPHFESEVFIDGEHIRQICAHLQEFSIGNIENLAANVPPQHCKSTLFSAIFPSWEWARSPRERYLSFSYSKEYALRDNWRARKLMQTDWYQRRWGRRWKFSSDQNVKGRYANNLGGQRVASSMGTAIGEGGTRIVIDDPQSMEQALSKDARDDVIRFYTGALGLRNFGAITRRALIMQRLNAEDLTGYLQRMVREGLENWVFLIFPITYEPKRRCSTYLNPDGKISNKRLPGGKRFGGDWRTQEGQPIWPELYGCTPDNDQRARDALERIRRRTPDNIWAAQGMQWPVPAGGSTFRNKTWFPTYTELPNEAQWGKPILFTVWDCAIKDKETNDPTAGFLIAYYPKRGAGEYYLLHRVYIREKFVGQEQAMRTLARMVPEARAHVIEGGGNGSALVSACNKWMDALLVEQGSPRGEDDPEIFQEWLPRGMSKQGRASLVSPFFRDRRIFFPAWAEWINGTLPDDTIQEFLDFPTAKHDDQVDAIDMGILWMETEGRDMLLLNEGEYYVGRPGPEDLQSGGLDLARDLSRRWTPL